MSDGNDCRICPAVRLLNSSRTLEAQRGVQDTPFWVPVATTAPPHCASGTESLRFIVTVIPALDAFQDFRISVSAFA